MTGSFIQVPTPAGAFAAYFVPSTDGRGPGIVLYQEIFGVNATMRAVADQLAEEGYSVLVPDLYWRQAPRIELGYTPEDFDKAFGHYQAFESLGVVDIGAALTHLSTLPELACAVGYYGVGIEKAWWSWKGCAGDWCCTSPRLTSSVRRQRGKPSWRPWPSGPAPRVMSIRASTTPSPGLPATTTTSPPRCWPTSVPSPRYAAPSARTTTSRRCGKNTSATNSLPATCRRPWPPWCPSPTSTSADCAQTGRWLYPVSKAALKQLTRCMALDLAPDGISVNSVSPGWT